MKAFYCATNDILVYANSLKTARRYCEHRLSPDYGHRPDRADNLALVPVSASQAERLDGMAITWEAGEGL